MNPDQGSHSTRYAVYHLTGGTATKLTTTGVEPSAEDALTNAVKKTNFPGLYPEGGQFLVLPLTSHMVGINPDGRQCLFTLVRPSSPRLVAEAIR